MRLFIDLVKSKTQRGEDRGGKYIKRVITGKDKDGSPQYRYLRTPEEVAAYEKSNDKKVTHEKQKKQHKQIEDKTSGKGKDDDEDKDDKPSLLVSKDKKVKKSLYVR